MNTQIIDAGRDASGGYRVDVSRGENVDRVSSEWFSRPNDERYLSLDDLFASVKTRAEQSRTRSVESAAIRVEAHRDDPEKLGLVLPGTDEPIAPTHWSFGQLSSIVGAPAAYLRQLPAPLAGINLQYGLTNHRAEQIKTMEVTNGRTELRAVTGPDYGRIYDHELVSAVQRIAGNGTGDTRWKVPGVLDWSTGIYNPRVDVTKEATTLYASDRDVFLFLVDDVNPIEAGTLPDGSPDLYFRGFYCWNSEVGAKTLGIAIFYLRAVCQNRNLWGVEDFQEIKIRHSKYAASRFAQEAAPALKSFANSSPAPFIDGIRAAREKIAVIKTRVVRHTARSAPLVTHLAYLQREGVTRDGEDARMFGPAEDDVDAKTFAERCEKDRHHFRFIVSPEDAIDMTDLKSFTRDLMHQAEKDLGTKLDWVGVDHWNTEHPHIHVIARGRTDSDEDLVIARDYIKEGMRARAQDLITQDLGYRTDRDIHNTLERQIDSECWTNLDRQLARDANRLGIIDLAPVSGQKPDERHALKIGRLRELETLGLADQVGPGQWVMDEDAAPTLRELGERGDIIKRIHRGLKARGIARSTTNYVLASEGLQDPVVGRLLDRGLDDELKGTADAVIDGVDGRTHHIRLPHIDAAGDSAPGSIVELRKFEGAKGRRQVALAVRSDCSIEQQVTAKGATWLDRYAVARDPTPLGNGGFGAEVSDALNQRAEHLIDEGFAKRHGNRVIFNRALLMTQRTREPAAAGEKLAGETGQPYTPSSAGEFVSGIYQRRLALASGRFAMINDGLGFQLVPWTPSVERHLGKHISGIARGNGGVDWDFGHNRGLSL